MPEHLIDADVTRIELDSSGMSCLERTRSLRRWLGLIVLGVAACSKPVAPLWTRLADEQAQLVSPDGLMFRTSADREVLLVQRDGVPHLAAMLRREEWQRADELAPGVWVAYLSATETRPLAEPRGEGADGEPPASQRLFAGEREFRQKPQEARELEPGSFQAFPGGLFLRLEPGEVPPDETTLELFALREVPAAGSATNEGRPAAAGPPFIRRVRGMRYAGDGFALWPGERFERVVDVPAHSVLRFATAVEPALVEPGAALSPLRFEVELDGERIFARDVPDASFASHAWHTVELPRAGRASARLVFRVTGSLAYAAFLAPVVGPRDAGSFGNRPWNFARPDIVLFVADTFRADNMSAYGSTLGLTPTLDALAERSRLFARTWSVGTFTLPVHTTMFTGVYPYQAAVVTARDSLHGDWTTLAEHLAANGYRTGAVTESLMVSQIYGLEQGFEWWDEQHGSLETTLRGARGFLDADDGRPTFLLVHTYRTHLPYAVSDAARAELGGRLDLADAWPAIEARMEELTRAAAGSRAGPRDGQPEIVEEIRRVTAKIQDHYRATARDLDRGVAELVADLERRGLDDDAWLVFTSDHGEAFYEHDAIYHACKVWEEVVRVPLFLRGPGVVPERIDTPVSLIDLAPTLSDMAGIAPHPSWIGRSLLRGEVAARPVFMFECEPARPSTLGIVDGERKAIGYEDAEALRAGRLFAAFDLAADPRERTDVAADAAATWPAELIGRHAEHALELLTPRVATQHAAVGATRVQELRDVGYAGDDGRR